MFLFTSFNVATRKFKITCEAHMIVLLHSVAIELFPLTSPCLCKGN